MRHLGWLSLFVAAVAAMLWWAGLKFMAVLMTALNQQRVSSLSPADTILKLAPVW